MRIVAGSAKGRTIAAPQGTDTRPTTDRVREALFSSLYSLRGELEGMTVLDAFAGTGALGLEAVSRGATRAVFYERDRKAADMVRKNAAACGFSPAQAVVVEADAFARAVRQDESPYDIVFLDPPYACDPGDIAAYVSGIMQKGALAEGWLAVYEHALASRDAVARALEATGFEVVASKKYGKTAVSMFAARPHDGREDRP